RNPELAERICGLARLIRTNALAALENVALWHERDISHSSVERVILPDSTILLDYLLHRLTEILQGLRVYPERMRENLERSAGLLSSQRVLLALTDKGRSREEAYRLVQGKALRAREEGADFAALLRADPEVRRVLSEGELAACFSPEPTLAQVDTLFERVGLLDKETE
ncbi:MAG TPA: adenylosuccinate lyase, partial [Candidatus Methylomirabilis sp.]|nr:adenylosuccinate lyase [Candidatus Methylomirabilis sp.]